MESSLTETNSGLVDFLKNHSIFQVLDRQIIEGLSPNISEIECGPGHVVFEEGDPADAIYIIRTGAVAVLQTKPAKVMAYLTAGECFGEMAILHDTPRTATIRVPEEAKILKLPSAALKEITKKHPAITVELADLINRRTQGDVGFKPPGLQGNLSFFDLPTVIQTVIGSRRNGLLILFGRSGKAIGQVTLRDSMIVQAQYDHLRGESALYELMNITDPLDFTFDNKEVPPEQVDIDLIRRQPYNLLLEGARRADELPKLMKAVGWPASTYEQQVNVPDLKKLGEERKELARQIWTMIEMGSNIESMSRQLHGDRYSVLTMVNDMILAGMVRQEPGKRTTEEVLKRTRQLTKPVKLLMQAGQSVKEDVELQVDTSPFEVVKLVNAVNGIGTNLGIIFGKMEVRMLMQEALAKSCKLFPNLSSIKVYVDSPALDMRGATAEFSQSPQSGPALIHLSVTLIELSVEMTRKVTD